MRCLAYSAGLALASVLAGCSMAQKPPMIETSQINPAVSPDTLASRQKAVAIMQIGSANTQCSVANAIIGVRDGNGYKPVRTLRIVNGQAAALPRVAEAELDPGDYHIIGYVCASGLGATVLAVADQGKFYRSYATFTLAAGEIINIGYLRLNPLPFMTNVYAVNVTDWPLEELERFKIQRPGIFNLMTTRLATVIKRDPTLDAQMKVVCGRAKGMVAEGKMSALPPACLAQPASPGEKGKAKKGIAA